MQYGNARVGLFDEAGREVGWKTRRDIKKRRDLVRAVNIILLNQANEVFMIKARNSLWPDKWGGSCAGLARRGESVIDAAHRTLLRELQTEARLQLLDERYRDFEGVRRIHAVLIGQTTAQPRISKRDIREAEWVSLGEANRMVRGAMCTPAFAAALDVVQRRLDKKGAVHSR